MKTKLKIVLGLLLVLVIYGVYQVAITPPQMQAPDILKAYVGRPVLVEFMNPDCVHCQNMAPVLDQLYSTYGQSVVFLSVSSGSAQATQQFIKAYHTPWTYTQDPTAAVFTEYQVKGTPTFCVVDSTGQIVRQVVGETSYGDLASTLQEVVNR